MRKLATILSTTALLILFAGPAAWSQAAPAKPAADATAATPAKPAAEPVRSMHCDAEMTAPERTFYLSNIAQQSDANEVVTALRNNLEPCDKIYLVPSQNSIAIRAGAENMALAEKLITELTHAKKNYRLTFTVTEIDSDKRIGTQHFAMVVVSGQNAKLKQGSKVPIATGSYNATATTGEHASPAGAQTQFTYLDVGMNFDATLMDMGPQALLRFTVEQSSVGGVNTIAGVEEPVIRQTSLSGEATLSPGKPNMLGSVDIPTTTRRLDIEVIMEPLP
jgi:type II secretory pathway component GspD/PulD (secretin)